MKRTIVTLSAIAAASTLAACGGSDPLNSTDASGASDKIVVGSADFSESILLAHIYAGALNAAGVNATTHTGIGAREVYLKALTDGSVQVVPEYTGALALYYDKKFDKTDPQQVYDALQQVLPKNVVALEKSVAEDNDTLTVTKATAEAHKLKTIADLQKVAPSMALGAPPEFKVRAQGVTGIKKSYGFSFGSFTPLKGQQLVQALKNGQVKVANIFSTDPAIAANGFVSLVDNKKLWGSQNVVPLASKAVAAKVTPTLNKVSAALTTEKLASMLKQTDIDHQEPGTVAEAFLKANGLG